jgi:C_GCAxxG_C_C family probable redox protein
MRVKLNKKDRQIIKAAGEKALANRKKGFHCSESTFLAINDTFKITDPSMVKMVTGFHGGGGTHRKNPGVDLTQTLEGMASGRETRSGDDLPVTQVGHLCGALAASIVCIGLLYGRESGSEDLTCVDELCYELHHRFETKLGETECRHLFPKWKVVSTSNNCEYVYQTASELAVELILEASTVVPECQQKVQ